MGKTCHHQSVFGPGRRVPFCREQKAQYLAMLKLNKRPNRLTGGCVELGRELVRAIGPDGRLDLSNEELARRAGLSESQAHECRKRMRALGFLDWERRLVRERDPDSITGWRTRQTSNAYVLLVPVAAAGLPVVRVKPRGLPDNADSGFRSGVLNPCFKERRSPRESLDAEQEIANANRDRQLKWLLDEAARANG